MLNALRQGAQGWVSKLLMLLLVLSFAVWGISGQFAGYGAGTLATVGDEEVTVPEFARAHDQLQRVAQQSGRQFAPEQVLQQLLLNAALDDEARANNLGISEDHIAGEIAADPTFQGPGGAFDRDRFLALLQNAGIDRDDYVRDVRAQTVREQIADAVGAGVEVPQPLVEALYRYRNEERTVSFIVVDAAAVEPIGAPDDAALQAYFEANRANHRAPEYRKLGILTLDPAALADPAAVTDEQLAAEYESRKETLTRPERRRIQQVRFDTADAAQQALAGLTGGGDLTPLAQARGLAPADIDQGLKTRAEIIDPAVAAAAFAAQPNVPVAVTEGALEPSVIQVTEIEPGHVTPLEEVAPRLRDEIAARTARERIQEIYDRVEDERAGGATLEEIGGTMSLPYQIVPAVARDGAAPDGTPVANLHGGDALLAQAYESNVGVENNPLRAGGDIHVFFDVLEIIPERDRTLDEARDAVAAGWAAEQLQTRIAEKADALFARLQDGEPLATVAAEIGKPVQTVEKVMRTTTPPGLSSNAAAQAFAGPQGHVANAESDTPPARILLHVDHVTAPAFFAEAADAKAIQEQLGQALRGDLLQTFNRELLQARETTLNNAAYAQLTGTPQTQ